jgi:phage terminase large subunit-like protein
VWLIRAGRGFGKTRAGAEWVRAQVESGRCRRVALVGETAADARDVMVEGESGLLATAPPWNRPRYEPSKRRLTWPNGAVASTYSADDPEQLRGPQHDGAWADEVAKWRYADAWDQLMLGLRKGDPRCVATTTPRPKRWLRAIMDDPATIVTAGTSFDNAANLSAAFLAHMRARHGGTRLGRQELLGEYLDDAPGALWPRASIERCRLLRVPELTRVVVAVDPAAGSGGGADETGIVVAGRGRDGKGYVLADQAV